jgi:hypothetical protein
MPSSSLLVEMQCAVKSSTWCIHTLHLAISQSVGVSGLIGLGVKEVFAAIDEARTEYMQDYYPELQRLKKKKEAEERQRQEAELARLVRDRAEGEEVPIATSTERTRRSRGQGVELRLHGDEDSEDSDDEGGVGERMEGESESASFQNFLKHQDKRATT